MSRLVDRILAGCRPFRPSLMYTREEMLAEFRAIVLKESNAADGDERVHELTKQRLATFLASEPIPKKTFDTHQLVDIPVIVGDDVAAYVASLPSGSQISDVVASMAPPFERFFVEFQGVSYPGWLDSLHSWGALVVALENTSVSYSSEIPQFEEYDVKARWVLTLYTFLEMEEWKPFGPVGIHLAGLAEDGTWLQHGDGNLFWAGGLPPMDVEPPREVRQAHEDRIAQLLFPVLLAISFMHCNNVNVRPISPPPKLSHKHRKKHGRELVRYHVLEVGQIRRVLDQHRRGTPDDLRRALHICRGHFKTFTPDAPLLGRHEGTYWWQPQVRGAQEHGIVLKDYRVRAPREFGKAYQDAVENPPDFQTEAPPRRDPDTAGRGLAAHNRTQNLVAATLRRLRVEPLSPKPDEPEFDLAWKAGAMFYVCEVKSATPANEERQLRMAIGQVIRYRQKLGAQGHEPIAGVIASERPPADPSWQDLCEREGIVLLWPEVVEERLKGLLPRLA